MEIIILMTAKDKPQAQKIAQALVQEKLIACANLVFGVQSIFSWQGKIDEGEETLVVMKTRKTLFKKVEKRIKALHSYEVPEIIAVPIIDGHKPYLNWLRDCTQS